MAIKRNYSLLILICSYLSLLHILRPGGLYLIFYVIELALVSLWFLNSPQNITFRKNQTPYLVYIGCVVCATIVHLATRLSFGALPKTISIILIGVWSFVEVPNLFFKDKKFRQAYQALPVVFGVVSSLIALLGVMEIMPFFYLNKFDEKFPILLLRSSSSLLFEPNVLAFTLLFALFYLETLGLRVITKVLILILLISGLFLTYSRGAWLAYLIFLFLRSSRRIKLFVSTLGISCVVVFAFYFYNEISGILVLDDILTGRPELWYLTITNLKYDLFFGMSFDLKIINEFLTNIFTRNYVTTHNYFIDLIMTTGILGFLGAAWFWFKTMLLHLEYRNFAFLVAILFFLQFSPHNLGGASFIAIYLTSFVGIVWKESST